MGETRKKELYDACEILGVPQRNVIIHSHTLLPDAMDVRWPPELVSSLISHHVDSLNITTIITFDRYGISYHNNHSSIYYAIANLILDRKLPKGVLDLLCNNLQFLLEFQIRHLYICSYNFRLWGVCS